MEQRLSWESLDVFDRLKYLLLLYLCIQDLFHRYPIFRENVSKDLKMSKMTFSHIWTSRNGHFLHQIFIKSFMQKIVHIKTRWISKFPKEKSFQKCCIVNFKIQFWIANVIIVICLVSWKGIVLLRTKNIQYNSICHPNLIFIFKFESYYILFNKYSS